MDASDGSALRNRLVVAGSAVGAVLVMAGVVLWARSSADRATPPSPFEEPAGARAPFEPRPPEAMPEGCDPEPDRPPHLVLDVPSEGLDFGALKQGAVVEREVSFRNDGRGVLCIRKVETGCGCVKATLVGEERRFPPGSGGSVKVRLDAAGREGLQKKTVTLLTNQPSQMLVTFTVRADVSLGLIVSHARLDFGRTTRGKPSTAVLRLRSPKDDAAWKVTGVEAQALPNRPAPPALTFESVEVVDAQHHVVDVRVTHPGRTDLGMFADQVVLRTDHPDRPEVHLPAYLEVTAPVLVYPPRASLGYVPSPRPFRLRLVPAREDDRFKVTGATVEPLPGRGEDVPFLVRFGPATEGSPRPGEWFVELRYDGRDRPPGPLEATLVVRTDVEEMPEARVPIVATVAVPASGR